MKRIGWTAMLLGVALMMAGCKGDETVAPGDAATNAQPADPGAVEQPVEGNSKVAGAVGKALWKGFLSRPTSEEPGQAPPFNP